MTKVISAICAFLLLLSSVSSFAQDAKADPKLVKELVRKSGLGKQIEQIPAVIQAGIIEADRESGNELSQGQIDDLVKKIAEAFDASILIRTVETHIRENMSAKDIRSVLRWVNSPLGRKISRLEAEASTPEAYIRIKEMSMQPIKNTARTELLSKLDEAVKATDIGMDITINLQVAFILAVTAELPDEERPSIEDIMREVNKNRAQLREGIRRETIAGFIYTYRTLTDSEVGQYIAFAESGPGRRYHAVSAAGLNNALMQGGLALGNKMVHGGEKGNGSI